MCANKNGLPVRSIDLCFTRTYIRIAILVLLRARACVVDTESESDVVASDRQKEIYLQRERRRTSRDPMSLLTVVNRATYINLFAALGATVRA